MQNLQQFIQSKFESLSSYLKSVYGSTENYAPHYIQNRGLAPYLETLRDQTLSLEATNELAFAYLAHSNRYPEEIHQILISIARQYNVDLPVVEGILTREYWMAHAEKAGWPNTSNASQRAA